MTKSKAHKVCAQCQQVRPLAEFDDELIAKVADMRVKTASGHIAITMAQELITLIRNHDKISRNQVIDECIEVASRLDYYCADQHKIIERIEGLKQ